MLASIIGYFNGNLYVPISIYIFIVSCGDFRWL
jgi:hypothetical protein